MAERRGPTDGKRYKRAKPSGNHLGNNRKGSNGKSPQRPLDTRNGETLLTDEVLKKLVDYIKAGNYAEVAARAVGIEKSTYYKWLIRGGRGEEPYKDLVDAIDVATAESQVRDVLLMANHANKHWQAAAWRLERKFPKLFGRKDSLELTGDEEKPIATRSSKVDFAKLSEEERALFMKLRDKMRVEEDDE